MRNVRLTRYHDRLAAIWQGDKAEVSVKMNLNSQPYYPHPRLRTIMYEKTILEDTRP